jgi:hypothetical protein
MATQGGYRKPGTPAPVSGPGALSRRTDGRVAEGYAYGMNKQINDQAAGAKLAKAPALSPARTMNVTPPPMPVTEITADTMRKDENILAGLNPLGQENDPAALGLPNTNDSEAEFNKSISSYYPVLNFIASRPNTSPETRRALAILMNGI